MISVSRQAPQPARADRASVPRPALLPRREPQGARTAASASSACSPLWPRGSPGESGLNVLLSSGKRTEALGLPAPALRLGANPGPSPCRVHPPDTPCAEQREAPRCLLPRSTAQTTALLEGHRWHPWEMAWPLSSFTGDGELTTSRGSHATCASGSQGEQAPLQPGEWALVRLPSGPHSALRVRLPQTPGPRAPETVTCSVQRARPLEAGSVERTVGYTEPPRPGWGGGRCTATLYLVGCTRDHMGHGTVTLEATLRPNCFHVITRLSETLACPARQCPFGSRRCPWPQLAETRGEESWQGRPPRRVARPGSWEQLLPRKQRPGSRADDRANSLPTAVEFARTRQLQAVRHSLTEMF